MIKKFFYKLFFKKIRGWEVSVFYTDTPNIGKFASNPKNAKKIVKKVKKQRRNG